ncbi:MAG TPA: hypothetical protein VFG03_01635 [Telluria sp.]|nr:hypothetical protein [Telluria sp.]
MNAITSVSQLVGVIRSRLAERLSPAPGKPRAAPRPAAARYAEQRLAGLIESRIRAIGRDDPQRGRKAFRVFLEAVLLSQLGEQLVNDPRFFQMVDDVQAALEADPSTQALVAGAIEHLLSQHD